MGQLLQVCGDVHGGLRPPVHPADAASGKHPDSGHMGNDHGGGHRRGSILPPGAQHCQIPAGRFGNGLSLFAEVCNLLRRESGLQPAADDGDGGGYRPVFPDDLLHLQSCLHILGVRHSVGDDGRFQSNHRLPWAMASATSGLISKY